MDCVGSARIQLCEHLRRALNDVSALAAQANGDVWYYNRVLFSDLARAGTMAPSDNPYLAERTYLKFHDTGLLDTLIVVHERRNGAWHDTRFSTHSRFASDPYILDDAGLVQHGRGKCAPPDQHERVFFNPAQ